MYPVTHGTQCSVAARVNVLLRSSDASIVRGVKRAGARTTDRAHANFF